MQALYDPHVRGHESYLSLVDCDRSHDRFRVLGTSEMCRILEIPVNDMSGITCVEVGQSWEHTPLLNFLLFPSP